MNLKYAPRSNPIECRTQFDNSVRELKLAGLTLPDKLHLAIWYKALPPELDSLRQALGAKPNLQWKDIYEAIVNQYSSKKASRNSERSDEKANTAQKMKRKRRMIGYKRDSNRNKPKSGDKPEKHCIFCERDYHDISECKNTKESKASVLAARLRKQVIVKRMRIMLLFIENEIAAAFKSQSADELAAIGKDSTSESNPIHFLFDSGATTHVTPVKHILNDINNAPVMTMSTAISGQRLVINKRGKVRLNDKWTLGDVAYVPQATSSLISEGRLCDAGYEIYKNKDFIHVRKNGKTVLRGRSNRLRVYTVNGTTSTTPRPIDTLVASKPLPKQAEKPDQSKEKSQSSTQSNRRIPKKGAPKPATAGGGGSSSQ